MRKKIRNSPRRENAIRQAVIYLKDSCGYWGNSHFHEDVGRFIWRLKYKADKYDVLNALCCGKQNKVLTFARADIRHRLDRYKLFCDAVMFLVMIHMIVSFLITICY